jgi:uncharacterized membrane protein YbaN (DUF454 family)
MGGWRQPLLVAAGTVCVVLGVVGIFLPLLPTTPFLLLAGALYARSSPRFYRGLLGNRYLGGYIRNYRSRRGIPLRTKVAVIACLWATIWYTALAVAAHPALRLALLAVALGVTVHLVRFPTYRPTRDAAPDAPEPMDEEGANRQPPGAVL